MLRKRGFLDPADAVVWTATAFLAALSGLGLGFVAWSVLAANNALHPWGVFVYLTALGISLAWPLARTPYLRLFTTLCGVTLLLSFALGGTLFSPLVTG